MATAKVIIVTGASRGIGLAISHELLKPPLKCNIIAIARSTQPLQDLRSNYPDQVRELAGDLADLSIGQKAVDLAISTWGRLDGLVVNHAVLEPIKRVADVDVEEWRKNFDVNLFSAVSLVKAALPSLRSTHGRIILTSSGAAVHAYSTWGCYGASKAALNHLAQTLAAEEPDVTTISIRPGVVDTEMQRTLRDVHLSAMDEEDAEKFRNLKRDGGLLRPEQPGNVMARLVVGAKRELSGRFLSWNDGELAEFQA